MFNMREDNVIRKATAYVVLGINEEGRKEVLSIAICENLCCCGIYFGNSRKIFAALFYSELKNAH